MWQETDLENPKLVEQGIQFGKDMWNTCRIGFEDYIKQRQIQGNPQSAKTTELGRKLIVYYDGIVNV